MCCLKSHYGCCYWCQISAVAVLTWDILSTSQLRCLTRLLVLLLAKHNECWLEKLMFRPLSLFVPSSSSCNLCSSGMPVLR